MQAALGDSLPLVKKASRPCTLFPHPLHAFNHWMPVSGTALCPGSAAQSPLATPYPPPHWPCCTCLPPLSYPPALPTVVPQLAAILGRAAPGSAADADTGVVGLLIRVTVKPLGKVKERLQALMAGGAALVAAGTSSEPRQRRRRKGQKQAKKWQLRLLLRQCRRQGQRKRLIIFLLTGAVQDGYAHTAIRVNCGIQRMHCTSKQFSTAQS